VEWVLHFLELDQVKTYHQFPTVVLAQEEILRWTGKLGWYFSLVEVIKVNLKHFFVPRFLEIRLYLRLFGFVSVFRVDAIRKSFVAVEVLRDFLSFDLVDGE